MPIAVLPALGLAVVGNSTVKYALVGWANQHVEVTTLALTNTILPPLVALGEFVLRGTSPGAQDLGFFLIAAGLSLVVRSGGAELPETKASKGDAAQRRTVHATSLESFDEEMHCYERLGDSLGSATDRAEGASAPVGLP
jgi:hypothetical protein